MNSSRPEHTAPAHADAPHGPRLRVRAVTLDLDDTLWPFAPIGARIEQVLDDWLRIHSPATAERFPIPAMRALREDVFARNPQLAHDMSALRRLTLAHAFEGSGADPSLVDAAYAVFHVERNRVECYPDAIDALARIAAALPVAALSNGNADLAVIGLDRHFVFQLGSREHGAAKPDPGIFLAACARLGCAPGEVLHVGDHIEMDVLGAARAGLRTAWVHREDARERHPHWPHQDIVPDVTVPDLAALADLIEAMAADDRAAPVDRDRPPGPHHAGTHDTDTHAPSPAAHAAPASTPTGGHP